MLIRALKVAQRLERDGFREGDRIATLAWNTGRHLEAWFGIMGMGGVYHTLNPRLFPDQIVWIMNHAKDRALFVDLWRHPAADQRDLYSGDLMHMSARGHAHIATAAITALSTRIS